MRPRMTDFESLYRKYAPDLYRFALYLSGHHAEAEDLASETFVRAWNSPEAIRAATAKAYLFTILRNLFLNQHAKKAKQTLLDESSLPDPAATPFKAAEQQDQLNWTLAALQRLPEIDRTVLLLRVQEELSYQEIADTVGLSLSAVKVKIHRARLKLTQMLSQDEKNYENYQECSQ